MTSFILNDNEMMRVALVSLQDVTCSSRQTPALVKVLCCGTLTVFGVSSPTMEMGYGWLPGLSAADPPIPLILVHVIGPPKYEEMKTRLHELCDVVLFEMKPDGNKFKPEPSSPWPARFIFWWSDPLQFKHDVAPSVLGNPIKIDYLRGLVTQDAFKSAFIGIG